MRYVLIIVILFTFTACQGGGDVTPQPEESSATNTPFVPEGTQVGVSEVNPDDVPIIETLIAEEIAAQNPPSFVIPLATTEGEALPVPPVGTLVASQTEDVQAGTGFDYIYMTQTGGANNESIVIEIYGDGRAKLNNREGMISRDNIVELVRNIDSLNFFGLQGTFMGPAPRPNEYVYQIYVKRGGMERLINAQDGYMPIEFSSFLGYVRVVAEGLSTTSVISTPNP